MQCGAHAHQVLLSSLAPAACTMVRVNPLPFLVTQMHNSCEKGDTPFAVTSAKNAAHMRAFLAKQKPGLYALNAFAGPTAWTHGGSVAHSTELGHLNGHNKWTASAGIPQQQAYFRQHYGGNHNVQCGASRLVITTHWW